MGHRSTFIGARSFRVRGHGSASIAERDGYCVASRPGSRGRPADRAHYPASEGGLVLRDQARRFPSDRAMRRRGGASLHAPEQRLVRALSRDHDGGVPAKTRSFTIDGKMVTCRPDGLSLFDELCFGVQF